MSIYVMSAVWKHGPEERSDLLVLLAIADYADDDGYCWPSMQSIAEKARMTERGAQKIVRRLEEAGLISVEIGSGRRNCNQYRVNLSALQKGEQETPNPVRPEHGSPRTAEHKPRTSEQKTPNRGSPEPSRTIKEPSLTNARGASDVRSILCQVLSEDAADAFIEHRKAKRAKLTAKAAQLIVGKLTGHPNPNAEIENAIMQGWTGIYPKTSAAQPAPTSQPTRNYSLAQWGIPD